MKSSKEDYPGDPPGYSELYLPGTVPQHPAPPLQPHYQPVFLNPQSNYYSFLSFTNNEETLSKVYFPLTHLLFR